MKKFFFDCGTRDATASLGLFVLRVGIGLMMLLGHGLVKMQNYQKMLDAGMWKSPDFFPFKHLAPNISLLLTISAEVGAAVLLILGLLTRPAAFVLGFTMVVAAFYAHANGTWFTTMPPHPNGEKELALLYLLPAVVLILTGAGTWSLDAAVYKEGKRKRW